MGEYRPISDLDDQAAELFPAALAQAGKELGQTHGGGRHVEGRAEAKSALLQPAGISQSRVDVTSALHHSPVAPRSLPAPELGRSRLPRVDASWSTTNAPCSCQSSGLWARAS